MLFLFDSLKMQYPHFYATFAPNREDCTMENEQSKLLIASKLPLQNIKFTSIDSISGVSTRGFFDFTIKSNDLQLVHVYLKIHDLQGNDQTSWIDQVLEKIYGDFLEQDKNSPFLLLEDFEISNISLRSEKIFSEEYSVIDSQIGGMSHALLIQPVSFLANNTDAREYILESSSFPTFDKEYLLISIMETNPYNIHAQLKDINERLINESLTIICADDNKNEQEKEYADSDSRWGREFNFSTEVKTDGSRSLRSELSASKRDGEKTKSVGIEGSISTDKDGNTSGRVKVEYNQTW